MNTELSAILAEEGRIAQWADSVRYGVDLSAEDKDISGAMDAWLKDVVGKTGCDRDNEIAQLVRKAITQEVVAAPSILIERMFNQVAIGEFDDYRAEITPKNTIKAHKAAVGGNVNRSFVDFKRVEPTWKTLGAETDITLQEIRRGGYRSVATLVTFIREALEYQKIYEVITAANGKVTSGHAGYVSESTAAPTETSAKALALYMMNVTDGETPLCYAQNGYIQTISGLAGATTYLTDREKSLYNSKGLLKEYAGMELQGFSSVKKMPGGNLVMPTGIVMGVAGKIGDMVVRGDANVYEATDINAEKIHIKVNGFTFGYAITDDSKLGKIALTIS